MYALFHPALVYCRSLLQEHTQKEETTEQKTANGPIVLVALKGMIHALGLCYLCCMGASTLSP
jgi:hypothetical protein